MLICFSLSGANTPARAKLCVLPRAEVNDDAFDLEIFRFVR